MWEFVLELLFSLIKGALLWVVGFTIIMGIIVLISHTFVQKKEPVAEQIEAINETVDYYDKICEIIRLITNGDREVALALELFKPETKELFIKKYLPELRLDIYEQYDAWNLMIDTLDRFGYLSYNDWKFDMEDLIFNLSSPLKKNSIDPEIFEEYPIKEEIIDPKEFPLLAEFLPNDYALLNIDTGEDSYVVTIAPISKARRVVEISDSMKRPEGIRSIELFKKRYNH